MFYLIRSRRTKDGLGIISVHEVLDESDFTDFIDIREWLIIVIEENLTLNYRDWYFEQITQAEYETYRDLHGFRVLIRLDTDLGYS